MMKPLFALALLLPTPVLAPPSPLDTRVPVRGAELAVSLALPEPPSAERVAAVVILPGSGPSTRAQMQAFAAPFLKAGLAVLTFDKRGCGTSTGSWLVSSLDDMASDGRMLLDWIKTQPGVDGSRVGLVGVSQGGWVAPPAAAGRSDVAFVIELTGGGVAPRAIETFDYERRLRQSGVSGAELANARQAIAAYFSYLEGAAPRSAVTSLLDAGDKAGWPAAMGIGRVLPDDAQRPSWSWVSTFDPKPSIRALRVPVLAVIGGLDRDPAVEVRAWQESLSENGNARTEIRVIPNSGHVLSLGDSHRAGNFNVQALEAVAAWAVSIVRP